MVTKQKLDKQNISALVDNELNSSQSVHSLDCASDEMERWARYNLIGQIMRNEEMAYLDMNIADKVSASLQSEPSILAPRANPSKKDSSSFWKQAGGFAIAASVALVALVNVYTDPQSATIIQPIQVATNSVANDNVEQVSVSLHQRQELQTMHDMFLKFNELSQFNGASSLPTVSVVSNQKAIPVTVNIPMRSENIDSEKESQQELKDLK